MNNEELQYRIEELLDEIEQKDHEIRVAFEANQNEGCTWEDMQFAKDANSKVGKLRIQKANLVNEVSKLQRQQRATRRGGGF